MQTRAPPGKHPAGHCWTWTGDRYRHTADGTETVVSQLFGRDATVISPCRDCAAFDHGATEQICPCSGYAVYCPAGGQHCCQVTLPDIPVFEEHS